MPGTLCLSTCLSTRHPITTRYCFSGSVLFGLGVLSLLDPREPLSRAFRRLARPLAAADVLVVSGEAGVMRALHSPRIAALLPRLEANEEGLTEVYFINKGLTDADAKALGIFLKIAPEPSRAAQSRPQAIYKPPWLISSRNKSHM